MPAKGVVALMVDGMRPCTSESVRLMRDGVNLLDGLRCTELRLVCTPYEMPHLVIEIVPDKVRVKSLDGVDRALSVRAAVFDANDMDNDDAS